MSKLLTFFIKEDTLKDFWKTFFLLFFKFFSKKNPFGCAKMLERDYMDQLQLIVLISNFSWYGASL